MCVGSLREGSEWVTIMSEGKSDRTTTYPHGVCSGPQEGDGGVCGRREEGSDISRAVPKEQIPEFACQFRFREWLVRVSHEKMDHSLSQDTQGFLLFSSDKELQI